MKAFPVNGRSSPPAIPQNLDRYVFASQRFVTLHVSIQHQTKEEYIMIKSKVIALLAAAVMIIAGTGCKHTAHGVGEDVEKMGEKIQEKTK